MTSQENPQFAFNAKVVGYVAPQRPWIGLNWDDLPEAYVGDKAFLQGAKWAEAKLREKNT